MCSVCASEKAKCDRRKSVINNFRTLIPALRLRPLNLLSASSVNLHGLADTSIFHNNLRVMLSPLKSPVLRKYSNPFKRPGMYPSISKCNAKRCIRNTVFNFKKLVSDLDIHANTPES